MQRKKLQKYNRSKKSELLLSLKNLKLHTFTKAQVDNVTAFLLDLADDEACSYVFHVMSKEYEYDVKNYKISKEEQDIITYFFKNEQIKNYLRKIR